MAPSQHTTRRILIAGDSGSDYNIYLPNGDVTTPPGSEMTIMRCSAGGAGLSYCLLSEAVKGDTTQTVIGFKAPTESAAPMVAIWQPQPYGKIAAATKQNDKVWRIQNSLSLGRVDTRFDLHQAELPPVCGVEFSPDVVLIEDNACKFRHPRGNDEAAKAPWDSNTAWIVWKMTAPLCHGEMWWKTVSIGVADRMVVVISVEDLRREKVRVSQRISWERTTLELARELAQNPALAELRRAAHVVVALHNEGALWMRRGEARFTLLFDPGHMEQEWAEDMQIQGEAYGYLSTFAAALAARVAQHGDPTAGLAEGITRGLRAMRVLKACGHGPVAGGGEPGFPAALLGAIIREGDMDGKNPLAEPLDPNAFGQFGTVEVPAHAVEVADHAVEARDPSWRIVEADKHRPAGEPLYGLARRVALFGESALRNVPHARFGKLLTADRCEIEALKNFKTLIEGYQKNTGETKPLSLAVFGPPGAGKSIGVKQIARGVLGEQCPIMEFNLSQFKDGDLISALNQVRDKVLEGHLPVVFWDEFDSGNYKWLQFLIAPMQDGKFQSGQLTHPIGRCIFVFAGATSYDMEHFGPPEPKGAEAPDFPASHAAHQDWTQFKLCKGPDFISRIHGALNVLGPDRRQILDTKTFKWKDDPADICFPLRRALLLRSLLEIGKNDRLRMDHGLLDALLEVSRYTNGARSFEKICRSFDPERPCYRRSDLPSDEVLALNLGTAGRHPETLAEFKDLLDRDSDFEKKAPLLAKAFHDVWRAGKRKQKGDEPFNYDCEFEQLPANKQNDNLNAAARMPRNLRIGGLYLIPLPGGKNVALETIPEELIDFMAQEEHYQWVEEALADGFRQKRADEKRDDEKLIHDCIVPWEKLPESQREYDRWFIRKYPEFARTAGYAIVPQMPKPASFDRED